MSNNDKTIIDQEYSEDSYCGLFCGACEIMLAYQREKEKGKIAQWIDISEEMRTHIREAEVICYGCKSDTVFLGCQGCEIRKCTKEKKLEYCNECPEFPCQKVIKMKDNIKRYEPVLPHTKTILHNLEGIQLKGKMVWIEEQKQIWTCPKCGARRSWYQKNCDICQQGLTTKF